MNRVCYDISSKPPTTIERGITQKLNWRGFLFYCFFSRSRIASSSLSFQSLWLLGCSRLISPEEFREKIANDEFVEYEEVYENRFYGTLKSQVEKQLNAGQNVIFDVDVKGGVNIKKFYGKEALSVFIQPPSIEELRKRLVGRATDSPEAIEERLSKASYELTFADQFDTIVVNDDLEMAKNETLHKVNCFLAE